MKALLVDDEFNVRDVIRHLGEWERLGIDKLLEAKNGVEAKMVIEQARPEIIITDLKMPKMNGIELLEWLDSLNYPGKVIILTGYDDYAFMRKAIHYGSFDYLLKPVEAEALNEVLAGAVRSWNSEAEERQMKEYGYYEEARRLRLNRTITAACEGEPYDPAEIAACLPEADVYDLNLIYFYQTSHPEVYINELNDELAAKQLGAAFTLQNDRHIGLVISVHGYWTPIEERLTRHVDIPFRLVSGGTMKSLNELPGSYKAALRAAANQNFRTIHRLSELDDARRMHDIVAYINKYFTEDVSLDTLSTRFFLSREHISRRFKQEKGMTLSAYVTQLRVEQAKRWLGESDEKMYSIALKLGYQDEKYFSKLFKKVVGMTPLEYRSHVEEQKELHN